ncbi:MAG: hypothetical protein JAY99_15145 [Candidatus Thiodiazotropha lotti]|uniref:Uncharacterized protein n=1 Tax=Candidatus Thiodiazotropha endoloripes TaxID=1818881 RepID=A0A1E2UPL3_9GAMM|nr:hypothetical protein [Candidatus Thiodiazotropha endoloripes]MCG7900208.1 hypothetical protein [Candidatus Thiodiazotropha weberae]MCG7993692.1 hypothetical protein [Candidatus Thiodiazotropha lotti]MCG7904112.1 hypothetical protein [Candidatus Thiodiazotropha weberae]MCG7912951.1 hypothetical protein [Candidatus Thiodiazotropha weberae]MCG8000855.1 hypothetical protein [Candidatus Thiodiazotropha lotti]
MTGVIESWLAHLLFDSVPTLRILSTSKLCAHLHDEIDAIHDYSHKPAANDLARGALLSLRIISLDFEELVGD